MLLEEAHTNKNVVNDLKFTNDIKKKFDVDID